MKRSIKWTLLTALILVVGSLLSFAFAYPTASALALAVVSRSLPDPGHAVSIREELQAQADFMQLIKRHEDRALARYRSAGDSVFVAREIYRVDASFFLPMPLYDDWEVWIRTDIVGGRPATSFLIRLGLIKDENMPLFFGDQLKSSWARSLFQSVIHGYNRCHDRGYFLPIRLNITDDATTSISRERLALEAWHRQSAVIHRSGF